MSDSLPYYSYSSYLKDKYGEKVYKLPINLPVSCPNRDGTKGSGGCIFCSDVGAGFENLSSEIPVDEQIEKNMDYIGKRYKAKKFIVYFQNFSNTYMSYEAFVQNIKRCVCPSVVEIAISTRPDCINDKYLSFLRDFATDTSINITIELGLQTVNYKTLNKINRGHTLGEFIDAVLRIHRYGFKICTHLILNLPWDDQEDAIENSKLLSALGIEFVKLHALYICENTAMGEMFKQEKLNLIDKDEYVERVIIFLEYLHKDISIQRIIGRAPEDKTLFCNWNRSWWIIKEEIESIMIERGTYQGKKCDYLNGSALREHGFIV